MKKNYFSPSVKFIKLESVSIIAASGDGEGTMSGGHDGAKSAFEEEWD